MPRLLRSLRFRNERHFDRARADLLRCVHPEESVPALLPLPDASASESSSSITWADSAPAVAAAKYDRPADRELVMAAALALDKKLAFLSLGPHSEAETRALLASTHGGGGGQPQPLLAVDATPHGAGLGVFAARDIEAGTVVTEYAGTTLVGADAAALRTAADEWGVVWEEAKAADGSSGGGGGGGGGGGEAMGAKAFGGAVQERYRKLHGFESLGREDGEEDGGGREGGEVGEGAEAVLIFGDSWTPGSGTGNLAGCGAIVNDGAALMAAVLGASEGEGEGVIHADLTAACEAYQRESLERATVAMVPRGSAMFAVANRDVCAGEELCFPYGSSWWFGHAREALLDEIAVLLYQQETSQSSGSSSSSGGSGGSGGSSSSGGQSNAAGDGEQCETMIDMLAAMEAASAATIQGERRLLGLTGGYERAGVAPLPGLPRGSPTTPPLLEFRLYERVVRLRYEERVVGKGR